MVKLYSRAKLPTIFGLFEIYVFSDEENEENAVLVRGEVTSKENVPVRIHSECLTGDVLGSKRCDCRDQLLKSLEFLGKQDFGMLIYLRQEGRGIGLLDKIRAYSLQDQGYDTVEANLMLGLPADKRDYTFAVNVIKYFDIKSIRLMTNNPLKIDFLQKYDIKISDRIPIISEPTPYDQFYLDTKRLRLGHQI
jgi:GTP cyclohydrolase II/3,4-dihydroxy 2-butanone 4-phosphate synthase/GTP cyclohydrolase II